MSTPPPSDASRRPAHGPPAGAVTSKEPVSEAAIARQLASLSWPIIGLNMLNVLALAVDTAMCGRLENAEQALTALGFATQLIFLLMVAMMGLVVGTVATVARSHGAGMPDRVQHTLEQSAQLTVVLGLVVAVLGNLFAPGFVRVMGGSEPVVELAVEYLRPMLWATALPYVNVLFGAALRGVGNTKLAFLIALLINGLNALFNYGFILGNLGFPALGLAGAAWGTILAYAIGVTTMVTLLVRGAEPAIRLQLRLRRPDLPLIRQLVLIGWPAALDMVVLNAAFLSIVGMLGRIDEVAVAAHGIGLRIQALAFVPGMSIAQATGALVGQALGAKLPERARTVLRASLGLNLGIMTSLTALLIGFDHEILGIFEVDPDGLLGRHALEWMHLLGYGMPIAGAHIAFVGLLQGAGATMVSLRINGFVTALQIPASWLLGFPLGLGAWGVWAAFPLAFVIKVVLSYRAYRAGTWARTGT
ncbi:MAG: MATE family efflux transporter [Deltaproteobacteria bacterium]|nr:MATE family efflux transporter [Deltaproteobacteria bacterium]